MIGPSSSAIPIPQQRPDLYRNVNQSDPHHVQKHMSPTLYNEMPDSRTGLNSCMK